MLPPSEYLHRMRRTRLAPQLNSLINNLSQTFRHPSSPLPPHTKHCSVGIPPPVNCTLFAWHAMLATCFATQCWVTDWNMVVHWWYLLQDDQSFVCQRSAKKNWIRKGCALLGGKGKGANNIPDAIPTSSCRLHAVHVWNRSLVCVAILVVLS